jgi:hypothetical protein
MKKIFGFLMIAGMLSFMACGNANDEAAEKARLDSLRQDSLRQDSIAKAMEQARLDSIAKARQDSIEKAKADSIAAAKAKKGGKKK